MAEKPKMSKEYLEVEEQNRQKQIAQENEAEAERTKVYWHQATRGQMANFVPEKRSGGVIVQSEEPLQFENHILSTSNPAVIDFVEGRKDENGNYVKRADGSEMLPHNSFRDGTVVLCKDINEALAKTAALRARRGGVKTYESVVSVKQTGTREEVVASKG